MASINRHVISRLIGASNAYRYNYKWIPKGTRFNSTSTEAAAAKEGEGSLSENEKKLTEEVDKLKQEFAALDDKYKRSLADADNMRKRLTKQIDDAKIFGIQSFCKDLLEVSDILVQASQSVPNEEINKNAHLKNLYEGLNMTKSLLFQVFKRNGLEEINPIDQQFNPNYHEALFQQEVPNKESNIVVVVSKVGFKLHERCIRPALVGVSK